VECPHCHYRFNYEFIPAASFYSIRLGTLRIFKCPRCKDLHKFNITHFGKDPSLPTHGDNDETGIGVKVWALLLGPLLALIIIPYIIQFVFRISFAFAFIVPVTLALIWIAVFTVYIYRKASRKIGDNSNWGY
jgi:hypothetical protein